MNGKEIKYFLGIDGGGTKTEFLLTDENINEIKRLKLGGSNPISFGIENTFEVLSEGIRLICCGIDTDDIVVFAGIAGAKTGENEKHISEFLSSFGFSLSACGSDVDLALENTLKEKNGTAVIMGTGIVAFSRNEGKLFRTGGRGYMIDKGGSGFHFGSAALNEAFSATDGRGGSEIILKLVEKKLSCSLEDGISEIYKGGVTAVASFAPCVFEAYKTGDAKACEIIERNTEEAAAVINGALNIAGNDVKNVVICGGLCKQKDILYPFIKKYLSDDVILSFNDEPMVNAAVALAEKLWGGELC